MNLASSSYFLSRYDHFGLVSVFSFWMLTTIFWVVSLCLEDLEVGMIMLRTPCWMEFLLNTSWNIRLNVAIYSVQFGYLLLSFSFLSRCHLWGLRSPDVVPCGRFG